LKILTLSYRNIWRNKRRTLITAASIMFAVFFSVVMMSIQQGAWKQMVDSIVHFYFGYAQIHQEGYWNDQSIDNTMDLSAIDTGELRQIDGLAGLVPRLESFALASYATQSKGVLFIGVDPEQERELTHLENRIIEGSFLTDGGVVLGEGLAEYLKTGIGDSVVFISQGYHGVSAVGLYPVTGIVHFPTPDLNKQLVFMHLADAQWFFGADNRVTSLVVRLTKPEALLSVTTALKQQLDPEEYEVMDYTEMIPEILEAKAFDTAGAYIILAILYVIIAFGIFGTMLMMLKEREYELGILKAIGMKSRQLQFMVWLETSMLMMIGAIAGVVIAFPLVWYLKVNPIRFTGEMAEAYEKFGVEAIMPALMSPSIFISQVLIVLLIVTVLTIYPVIKIKRLKPVEAMRH
jgi:ABC-type lipoprotein release transport system permease subunit